MTAMWVGPATEWKKEILTTADNADMTCGCDSQRWCQIIRRSSGLRLKDPVKSLWWNNNGHIRFCSLEIGHHSLSSSLHFGEHLSFFLMSARSKWTLLLWWPQRQGTSGLSPYLSYSCCAVQLLNNSVSHNLLAVNESSYLTDISQSWPCGATNHQCGGCGGGIIYFIMTRGLWIYHDSNLV